jgi:PAS domain S-box-containing protein
MISVLLMGMTLICSGLVTLLILIGVAGEIRKAEDQFAAIRSTYAASRRETIRNRVRNAVEILHHMRSQAEERVRREVKSRTLEAHAVATHVFETRRDLVPAGEMAGLIRDVLYPASWDGGSGYYFAEHVSGIEMINRNNPDLEGKDVSQVRDSRGTVVMQVIRDAALSPLGEGFCRYYWNRPGYPEAEVPKISYVKYFAPLEWIIGSGKYLSDEEEVIKKEALKLLSTVGRGGEGYLFAADFQGLSLSGPFEGQNMIDLTDTNGVRIVRELIAAARAGGGFVEYVAPRYEGQEPRPKVSYVEPIPQWEWYVGTGVYLDEIETVVRQRQEELKRSIRNLVAQNLAILAVTLGLSFFLVRLLAGRIRTNLDLFTDFFRRSAAGGSPLDREAVAFSEFQSLAESANRMALERRQWERALRESEERLSVHLQNTPVGAVFWDPEFRVVDWNPAMESLFGYTREQAVGRHVTELILPPDMVELVDRVFRDTLAGTGGLRSTNENVTRDGRRILCDWYNARLTTADGVVTGVASLVTDITERKRTEALLIQSEKMMSVGTLAAGMAHEINNPLAGMMQNAQVIRNRLTASTQANRKAAQEAGTDLEAIRDYVVRRDIQRMLGLIISAGDQAARIVHNMLDFTRRKSSEKRLNSVTELLDSTLELAWNDYSLVKHHDVKRVRVVRQYQPGLPEVPCEAGSIRQVFFNIVKNAAEAMFSAEIPGREPSLTLRASVKGHFLQVEIEDNGPGMDRDTCSRVFEPFFTTKDVDKGTGLGLAVSYFIVVDDHQGEMEAVSTPGSGTVFIIRLPRDKGGCAEPGKSGSPSLA